MRYERKKNSQFCFVCYCAIFVEWAFVASVYAYVAMGYQIPICDVKFTFWTLEVAKPEELLQYYILIIGWSPKKELFKFIQKNVNELLAYCTSFAYFWRAS